MKWIVSARIKCLTIILYHFSSLKQQSITVISVIFFMGQARLICLSVIRLTGLSTHATVNLTSSGFIMDTSYYCLTFNKQSNRDAIITRFNSDCCVFTDPSQPRHDVFKCITKFGTLVELEHGKHSHEQTSDCFDCGKMNEFESSVC